MGTAQYLSTQIILRSQKIDTSPSSSSWLTFLITYFLFSKRGLLLFVLTLIYTRLHEELEPRTGSSSGTQTCLLALPLYAFNSFFSETSSACFAMHVVKHDHDWACKVAFPTIRWITRQELKSSSKFVLLERGSTWLSLGQQLTSGLPSVAKVPRSWLMVVPCRVGVGGCVQSRYTKMLPVLCVAFDHVSLYPLLHGWHSDLVGEGFDDINYV